MKKLLWIVFVFLSVSIGLYPLIYFFIEREFGLLSTKSAELLNSVIWNIFFYVHIIAGGIALLVGWIQFNDGFRKQNISTHRLIGKIYFISVCLSGVSGIYIGIYATGGMVSAIGFILLAVFWLYTTLYAVIFAKRKKIMAHRNMMLYSYAACFAAVTLRLWLPLLTATFSDFVTAYRIVAWLCWIPNVIIAMIIVNRKTTVLL